MSVVMVVSLSSSCQHASLLSHSHHTFCINNVVLLFVDKIIKNHVLEIMNKNKTKRTDYYSPTMNGVVICRVCLVRDIRMYSMRNTLIAETFEILAGAKVSLSLQRSSHYSAETYNKIST